MKQINQQEFFALLKKNSVKQDRELDLVIDAVETMAAKTDSALGLREQHALSSVTAALRESINALRVARYSVRDYFTGQGPVAKAVLQHRALDSYFFPEWEAGMQSVDLPGLELQQALDTAVFRYPEPLPQDCHAVFSEFFKNEVAPLVYSEQLPLPVLQHDGEFDISVVTGFYRVDVSPLQRRNFLVLNAALPMRDGEQGKPARCLLLAGTSAQPRIFYYHPYEDEWLAGDFNYFVHGTMDALRAQFDAAMNRHQSLLERSNWAVELGVFQRRVEAIFENQGLLPETYQGFVREGDGCQIEVVHGHHVLNFSHSSNEYGLTSCNFFKRHGGLSLVTTLQDLTLADRNHLFYKADHALTTIETKLESLVAQG